MTLSAMSFSIHQVRHILKLLAMFSSFTMYMPTRLSSHPGLAVTDRVLSFLQKTPTSYRLAVRTEGFSESTASMI